MRFAAILLLGAALLLAGQSMSNKVTVQAAVSPSGRAQIKNVFVDGKPFAEAMKEPNR
jgi:hypothetical protein